MAFNDDLDSELVADTTAAYQKAATFLPFKASEIKQVFSVAELTQLEQFTKAMAKATTDNEKNAKLMKYPSVVLKLLQLAKIV